MKLGERGTEALGKAAAWRVAGFGIVKMGVVAPAGYSVSACGPMGAMPRKKGREAAWASVRKARARSATRSVLYSFGKLVGGEVLRWKVAFQYLYVPGSIRTAGL